MKSKKKIFFQFCSILPLAPLLAINKTNSLFIPIYHAITNERLIHLEHILPYGSKNSKQFEQDIDLLLKNLTPISYDDLLNCYQKNIPVPPKSFIITFDDGLRQTYENAVEILLRKGVPAIFFLNTSVLDNKALLHRYKASVLIDFVKSDSKKSLASKVIEVLNANQIITTDYYSGIKVINFKNRQVLDRIADAIDFSFENYLKENRPYMTSLQVQDIKNKGFVLGSHSANHPEFWNIETDEQVREAEAAMKFLKEHFNELNRTFSFPFTDIRTPLSFFKKLQNEAPFELLFGSQKLKKDVVPNMVHRFDGDNNLSDMQTYLKALLVFETLHLIRGNTLVNRATD